MMLDLIFIFPVPPSAADVQAVADLVIRRAGAHRPAAEFQAAIQGTHIAVATKDLGIVVSANCDINEPVAT
jgi:hypothetical protein